MVDTTRAEVQRPAGIVRRDLLLDGTTVLLLVVGVLLPWDTGRHGFEDVPLRVAGFIALLTVLVPHAVRWDGLPLPWPAVCLVKALLVAPLGVLVLERAVVLSGHGHHTSPPPLAVLGFAVLLTAVAAAVQPRAGERTRLSARGWALAALALGAASVVAEPVATTLDLLGSWSSAGSAEWAYVTAELLVPGAALAVVVANVALRRDGWAHCATVLGLTTLALVWLDGLQVGGAAARAVSLPDALTVGFLVLGLAALLASRPVADPGPVPPARSAVACGRAGLTVLLVEAAAQALGLLLLAVVDIPTAATLVEVAARLLLVGALVAALVLLRRPDPSPVRRQVAAGLALLPCLAGAALLLLAMLNRPDADGGVTGFTFAPLLLTLSLGAGVYTVLALLTRGDLPASRVG